MLHFIKILLDITVKDRIFSRMKRGCDPFKGVVLKVWFSDQHHWHHLWACCKCGFMDHDLLNQDLWEWGPENI